MAESPTEAIRTFLGPLMAEYALLYYEAPRETEVTIAIGGYVHKTTVGAVRDLEAAMVAADERANKAAQTRSRKRRATELPLK